MRGNNFKTKHVDSFDAEFRWIRFLLIVSENKLLILQASQQQNSYSSVDLTTHCRIGFFLCGLFAEWEKSNLVVLLKKVIFHDGRKIFIYLLSTKQTCIFDFDHHKNNCSKDAHIYFITFSICAMCMHFWHFWHSITRTSHDNQEIYLQTKL